MATMGPMGPIGKFGLLDQLLVSDQLPPRIQGAHVGALRPVLAGSFQIHSSKAERNRVFAMEFVEKVRSAWLIYIYIIRSI